MKDLIAPITAMGVIFGGFAFMYLTLSVEGAQVQTAHLAVTTAMGAALQYLFGADIQQRANSNQPTITTTAGPPQTTVVTAADPARASYDGDPYENVR